MDNDRQTVRIILNEKLTSFYTEDFAGILNDYLQNMDIGSIKKANSISVPNGSQTVRKKKSPSRCTPTRRKSPCI